MIDGVGGDAQTDGARSTCTWARANPKPARRSCSSPTSGRSPSPPRPAPAMPTWSRRAATCWSSSTSTPTAASSFTDDDDTTRYIDLNDPRQPGHQRRERRQEPAGHRDQRRRRHAPTSMNYVSRNVSVVNLTTDTVVDGHPRPRPARARLDGRGASRSARRCSSPRAATSTAGRHHGLDRRAALSEGWQNCASCHFDGLTDGNVWVFGAGPRKSVPLNATFNPHNPDDQRDPRTTRRSSTRSRTSSSTSATSPARALPGTAPPPPDHACCSTRTTADPDDADDQHRAGRDQRLRLPNAGRTQHTVTLPGSARRAGADRAEGVGAARDPHAQRAARQRPRSTAGSARPTIAHGRVLFVQAGCQTCHGGSKWTTSFKDFVSPPGAGPRSSPRPIRTRRPFGNPVGDQYLDRFLERRRLVQRRRRRRGQPDRQQHRRRRVRQRRAGATAS